MRLFLLLVAVPIIEIALFIEIGGMIGTWPTVGIVILTALIGSIMLRQQGLAVIGEAQRRLEAGENPGRLLADGVMILFAGALLLTPGFFTDAVGFALLVPPIRNAVWNYAAPRIKPTRVRVRTTMYRRGTRGGPGQTVDGDYEDVTPDDSADPDPPDGRLPPR